MEQYRAHLKRRMWFELGTLLSTVILTASLFFLSMNVLHPPEDYRDFLIGFAIGIFVSMVIKTVLCIAQFVRLLRSPERLEQAYVRDTDERECYLALKAGQTSLNILLNLIGVAAIISAFFSKTVTLTLACVLLVFLLVLIGTKAYYRKKI